MTATGLTMSRPGDHAPAPSFGSGQLTAAAVRDLDPSNLATAVCSLSKTDVMGLDRVESEAYVIACERLTAAVEARQSLAMDTLAGRIDDDLQRERAESGLPSDTGGCDTQGITASTLSPSLHCATRTALRRLVAARWLTCEFDAAFDAAWDGDLERRRADAVVDAGLSLSPELRGQFEALVLESSVDEVTGEYSVVSDRVRELSHSELTRRATKIARQLDPDSARTAVEHAHAARRVVVQPDRDRPGMTRWVATLPVDTSLRMAAAMDALAGQYARANPGTPIDAARADALSDLVLSRAEVSTVVELLVPTLPATAVVIPEPGPSDLATGSSAGDPAEESSRTQGSQVRWIIPGFVDDPRHGELAPEAIARLLADPDVTLRLARLDPDGSIVQDPNTYRPSASVRRWVRARDGSCRFPGCHTPARNTDLDHVIAFPHAPTEPANLICLCRTHHGFKHHGGWRLTLAEDGTASWRAPDGRTWVTEPRPHGLREDLRLTTGANADQLFDLRRGWLPGLPPGMTVSELAAAEDRLLDDPPEVSHVPATPADWSELDDAGLDDPQLDDREVDDPHLVEAGDPPRVRGVPPAVTPWSALELSLARVLARAA